MLMFVPHDTKLNIKYSEILAKDVQTLYKYRIIKMHESLKVPLSFEGVGKELVGNIYVTKKIHSMKQHDVPLVLCKVRIKNFKRVVYMPVLQFLTDIPLNALL